MLIFITSEAADFCTKKVKGINLIRAKICCGFQTRSIESISVELETKRKLITKRIKQVGTDQDQVGLPMVVLFVGF